MLKIAAAAALVAALTAAPAPAEAAGGRWTAAWAAGVQRPSPDVWYPTWAEKGFTNHSVRQTVRVTAAGSAVRIRLSNAYGVTPLRLTGASVGKAGAGAAVQPGTLRPLTFARAASLDIPAGGQAASDPVRLAVEPGDRLTVTLYVEGATGPATYHNLAQATSYRASGDHTRDLGAAAFAETNTSWFYLSGVDVQGGAPAVAAFGDSITDGYAATLDADDRYPDALARRLNGRRPVLNLGIAGNRLLNDSACLGERGVTRFRRDVLDQPRIRSVIVLEGINDIVLAAQDPTPCTTPVVEVSAGDLIGGYRKLIRAAHARGVRIIGGTLLPARLTGDAEAVRDAVNAWIRTGGEFDAVADFERAVADPADPDRIRPAFDSGDHLHPNPAGYQAMADAVDPRAL
ncbi:SGNH/GDSL hydrolase family protein [Nonomuraea roseoviolacea subsp. roseoviolacea]|uniref:Lysophospholipase L1-like esterase n=1 Tax=Nonomuraea roseoviolacea subsp. carminata TaxID=160689 RepID=A0ABT1KEX2_9ACTN|nr:SGNH/GDSL hydrolase family protein [Nonomuraea roseoviolacea]MCP2351906.1 lysophospholipase L1-like esterase [Nonomuraea roseoviolacea subsp. carminata]